jgi:hypothetical protein
MTILNATAGAVVGAKVFALAPRSLSYLAICYLSKSKSKEKANQRRQLNQVLQLEPDHLYRDEVEYGCKVVTEFCQSK